MSRRSLTVNSIFNVVHRLVQLLFPLITSVYVSRILSVEGIGKVTTANNLVSYFVVFSALGIPTYGLREIAKLKERSKEKDRLFTELLLVNAISTLICTFVYLCLILNVDLYSSELPLYLCTGGLILFNFINIDWLYKGSEEYAYITLRSLLVKVISLAAIFIFVRDIEDYMIYAVITCLASGTNYFFNVFNARKLVGLDFHGLKPTRHLRPIAYLFAGTFFSTVYSRVDVTMLGLIVGEESTAFYSYPHRIIELAILGCAAISEVFLPRLTYCYRNDRAQFDKILDNGLKILIFLSLPMTAGLALLAPQVIQLLYGADFAPAASALRYMTVLIPVKSIGDLLCYQVVICTGNEKKRLPAYGIAALANVILNTLLIPFMAQDGAVIASVISEFIVNGYLLIKMRSTLNVRVDAKSTLVALLSTGLMSAAVIGVLMIAMPLPLQIAVAVASGVCVYFAVNLICGNPILKEAKGLIRSKGEKQ